MQETQLEAARSALGPAEVQELERQFSRQPTEEILRWAWERFGTRAAIRTSFQGAGLVMMHLAKEHGLPFPLLSDPNREIVEAYHVWVEKSMYGKKYMGTERTTYLIGPDQKIKAILKNVKATGHVALLLRALAS